MTLVEVQARLLMIRGYADERDAESAHEERDQLWRDALQAISSGHCTADAACLLAREALKTEAIAFGRWYA